MSNQLLQIQTKATPIFKQHGIIRAGVFGSVARGEDTPHSDIDMLVTFKKVPGLIKYIQIESQLSNVLGKKVDLATENSLHRLIRSEVHKDLQTIYEE